MKNLLVFLFVSLFLGGATPSLGNENPDLSTPEAEGRLIYQEMGCVMCHGEKGRGDGQLAETLNPKPRNFTSYVQMKRVPYQSMYKAIKEGIPASGMPSFNLSDTQINNVISYISSLLTENFITLNTCSNVPQKVSLADMKLTPPYNIEIDENDMVDVSSNEEWLFITPNFTNLMKAFKTEQKKMKRLHVNLTNDDNGKKNYQAIIVLRIGDCIR